MADSETPTTNAAPQQRVSTRTPKYVCLSPDARHNAIDRRSTEHPNNYPSDKSPTYLNDEGSGYVISRPVHTSTPNQRLSAHESVTKKPAETADTSSSSFLDCNRIEGTSVYSQQDDGTLERVEAPIIGYETLEERAKFTVFKLEVRKSAYETWFIFRRYSDFERLKRQLQQSFPNVCLLLPSKKWFGDNFDTTFLAERMAGLQIFLDSILSNKDVSCSAPVREFLCFDEPPGPYDSMEESRAMCESLEDQVYKLTLQLQEKDNKCRQLESELKLTKEKLAKMENSERCSSAPTISQMDSNENLTHPQNAQKSS